MTDDLSVPRSRLACLWEPATEIVQDLPVPITRSMHLLWLLRDDLGARYALAQRAGRAGFLAWCLTSGSAEYRLLADIAAAALERLVERAEDPRLAAEGFSHLMSLLWEAREDLRQAFPRDDPGASARFLFWWLSGERAGSGLHALGGWQREHLLSGADVPSHADVPLLRLHKLVYDNRPDLQGLWALADPQGQRAFLRWYRENGAAETNTGNLLRHGGPVPGAQSGGPEPRGMSCTVRRLDLPTGRRSLVELGVNLIGHAFGDLGIGQDLRMMVRSCEAAGIPHTVVDFPPGSDASQADRELAGLLDGGGGRYPVNVFCLTAFETFRLLAERGPGLFDGRINIGYWPWELPRWPGEWRDVYLMVDEIWAHSGYLCDAWLANVPLPVHWMPPAVELGPVGEEGRADFGLPEAAYLFLTVFDCNSRLTRKNPQAVVAAFADAFPRDDDSVGLVVKLMNPRADDPELAVLRAAIGGDRRVRIIDRTLPRPSLNALYRACDCCVSLHRAEGFGRVPAEAMLLGKAVIATDFSGSCDFCRPDACFPVGYDLVPVGRGAYAWGDGQVWAEPSHAEAVGLMRLLAGDPTLGRIRGARGRELLMRGWSAQAAGERYRQRLGALYGDAGAASGGTGVSWPASGAGR